MVDSNKQHLPCPCGESSDAFSYHKDGWWKCFSCGKNFNEEQLEEGITQPKISPKNKTKQKDLLKGEAEAIKARGLTQATCKKFQYLKCKDEKGQYVQAATYCDEFGNPVAQKVRTPDKKFRWVGKSDKVGLYGQHLWEGGKRIIICEGEVDCLTTSQVYGNNKWATVSLTNGASSAVSDIKKAYEYLLKFEEIILFFDNDESGRTAAKKCAEILPVGRVKIAVLGGYKDASEAHTDGASGTIATSIFEAKSFRADGIVAVADLRDALRLDDENCSSIDYPFRGLTDLTKGLKLGSLVTICSGTGVGKSTLVNQLALHLHKLNQRVGMVMLEEDTKYTLKRLLSIHSKTAVDKFDEKFSGDDKVKFFDEVFSGHPMYFFDHWGSTDVKVILSKIRYMAKSLDVKWVFLDHLSILVSGLATTDERKLVDMAMTLLRTLVAELGIGLIAVTHLRRPDGNLGHEQGARVSLNQLRSSHSVAQLSDYVIGMNVPKEDPHSDFRELIVLKNRFNGRTGEAGLVQYDRETGILSECPL